MKKNGDQPDKNDDMESAKSSIFVESTIIFESFHIFHKISENNLHTLICNISLLSNSFSSRVILFLSSSNPVSLRERSEHARGALSLSPLLFFLFDM